MFKEILSTKFLVVLKKLNYCRGSARKLEAGHRTVRQGDPPRQHGAGDGAPVRAQGRGHGADHRQRKVRHHAAGHGHVEDRR